eukprot:TRINITY_DN43707_c0_g1_i1.p1 TRINITY_DN43707_c0_g1~~TRINITY_DN43707_c0_g1_i1.p1  ORF type:complete len:882 (+),score=221.63 TRINITY_DN43707_c0_g1_i1:58-2703(+)
MKPQPPKAGSPRRPSASGDMPGHDSHSSSLALEVGQDVRVRRNFKFTSGRGVLAGTRARITNVTGDVVELRVGSFIFDFDEGDLSPMPGAGAPLDTFEVGSRVVVRRTVRFESGNGVMEGSPGVVQGPGEHPGTIEVRTDSLCFDCPRQDIDADLRSPRRASTRRFSEVRMLPTTAKYSTGDSVLIARSSGTWTPATIRLCDDDRKVYAVEFAEDGGVTQKEIAYEHARWHLRPGHEHDPDVAAGAKSRRRSSDVGCFAQLPRSLPSAHAGAIAELAEWIAKQPADRLERPPADVVAEWARMHAAAGTSSPGNGQKPQRLPPVSSDRPTRPATTGDARKRVQEWLAPTAARILRQALGDDSVCALEGLIQHLLQLAGSGAASLPRRLDGPQPSRRIFSQIRDWARWQDHLRGPCPGAVTDSMRTSHYRDRERTGSPQPPRPGSRSPSPSPTDRRGYSTSPPRRLGSAPDLPAMRSRQAAQEPLGKPGVDKPGVDKPSVGQLSVEPPATKEASPALLQHRASTVIQRGWRRTRVRRKTLTGTGPQVAAVQARLGEASGTVKRMDELRAEERRLSMIGSPSDEELAQLDQVRRSYDGLKYDIVELLSEVPDGATVTPSAELGEDLKQLLLAVCREGDQRDGSAELVEALLTRVSTDFRSVIDSENLLVDQCPDGNVRFLKALLDYPSQGTYDVVELVGAACFSQTARIPLVATVLSCEHVDIQSAMEDVQPILQEFFEDIASKKKLIPSEERSGRHPLLHQMLCDDRISLDLTREDAYGHTVFTRCCYDGDLLLLSMLKEHAMSTVQPTKALPDGTSALLQSIIRGHTGMVKELVRIPGCDLDQEFDSGTALGVAEALKRKEVVTVLRRAGASVSTFREPTDS